MKKLIFTLFLTSFVAMTAVAAEADVENVGEYLLRHLILRIDSRDLTGVVADRDLQIASQEPNQLKIWQFYLARARQGENIDSSELFVEYADLEKTQIKNLIWKKPGSVVHEKTPMAQTPQEMILLFADQMRQVLQEGKATIRARSFEEVQRDPESVLHTNVAGRKIRIAGVDEGFENFLLENLRKELRERGFQLVEAYYFGSRVMTRDVLLGLVPSISDNLSLNKGRLVKNQVREGGLTNISDLEIFLVVKPLESEQNVSSSQKDQLQLRLRDQVRSQLNTLTRRYPLGMKILVVDKESQRSSYFSSIQKELLNKKNWLLSAEQYAQFYPEMRFNRCERALP